MLNPNNPSPGVYTYVEDRGAQTDLASGGVATLCLPLPRGAIGVNMIITKHDVARRIGAATGIYKDNVNKIALLAEVASYVNVCRVGINAKRAGVVITTHQNFATCRSLTTGITDLESFPFSASDIAVIAGKDEGDYANDLYITFTPDQHDPLGIKFTLNVYEGSKVMPSESFTCTTFYFVEDGTTQLFIEDVINTQSNLITVRFNYNNAAILNDEEAVLVNAIGGGPFHVLSPNTPNGQLTLGSDGDLIDINHSNPDIANNSLAAMIDAWDVYKDWETTNVGIACDGGYANPAISAKIHEINEYRSDSIGTLNLPVAYQSRDLAVAYRNGLKPFQGMTFNIKRPASTLTIPDVKARDTANARDWRVPASVCMAYTMLICDRDRAWLAPAGVNRGGLPFALSTYGSFDQDDRDILVASQINPLIHFNDEVNSGIYVWNADTLYPTNSPRRDIGVERMLCLLNRTVRVSYLRYVFKMNGSVLREQIKQDLEKLLQPIKDGEGLDWFEIVISSANNSDGDEANGDLIVDVFLDPTRYTKRIQLNANIAPTGKMDYVVNLLKKAA